jgi:CRISPR-associated endonuclease Cas3-HD
VLRIDERTLERIANKPDSAERDVMSTAIGELRKAHGFDPKDSDQDELDAVSLDPDLALDNLRERLGRWLRTGLVRQDCVPFMTRLLDSGELEATALNVKAAARGTVLIRPKKGSRWSEADDLGPMESSVSEKARVSLRDHQEAVADRTRVICKALGLAGMAELLAAAAGHHDLGKIDPRFQAALADGDLLMAELADEPIAKSGFHPASEHARDARRKSGLPNGFRHEIWSSKLAEQVLRSGANTEDDLELVSHLVAAHHGRCRPYFQPVIDTQPRTLEYQYEGGVAKVVTTTENSADLDTVARFNRLNERYGHWGLALLESIVRLADQTCSAEGT